MNFVSYLNHKSRLALTWVQDLIREAGAYQRPRRPQFLAHNNQVSFNYLYTNLHMAILDPERRAISNPTNCRDYLNEVVRYFVTGGQSRSTHVDNCNLHKFDHDHLRLILFYDAVRGEHIEKIEYGLRNGVRLANMYGRVAGWRKLRLAKAAMLAPYDEDRTKPNKTCFVLVGPTNWFRAPQILSVLILLLRVCLRYRVPKWITDAYALQGYWDELLNSRRCPDNSDFSRYLRNCYDRLLTLVAHEKEIFPDSAEENYSPAIDFFHSQSGINSMVEGHGSHKKAADKLQELYREEIRNDK